MARRLDDEETGRLVVRRIKLYVWIYIYMYIYNYKYTCIYIYGINSMDILNLKKIQKKVQFYSSTSGELLLFGIFLGYLPSLGVLLFQCYPTIFNDSLY
jgi:hypothetical protein